MKLQFNFFTVIVGGSVLLFGFILVLALNQPDPRLVDSCGEFEPQRLGASGRGVSGAISKYFSNKLTVSSNQKASKRHAAMDKTFFKEQLASAKLKLEEAQERERIWQEKTPLNNAISRLSSLNEDPYYQARLAERFNEEVKEYKVTSETYQKIETQYTRRQQLDKDRWIREKSEYESQIKRHQAGIPKTSTTIVSLENILKLLDEENPSAARAYIAACSRG